MNYHIDNADEEIDSSGKLILPILGLARFVLQPPGILTGLLLIDIARSFATSVGVMAQIRTFSSLVGVFGSLLMGILSVRFKHKSLLMTGLLFICVSAIGCFYAPTYVMILISYSFTGIGSAMVNPMSTALTGRYLPLKRRATAIGWMIGASALAYLVSAPTIAFIDSIGGWRIAFLGYVLPISILSLILAAYGLPTHHGETKKTERRVNYLEALKAVLVNASPCLIGTMVVMILWSTYLAFASSFIRQKFLVSAGFASISTIIGATSFIVGSVLSGRIVNRFGRKKVATITSIPASTALAVYFNMPSLWLTLALGYCSALLSGMLITAATNLALEQLPLHRGTMMSINASFGSLGSAVGIAIGGWIIHNSMYNYVGFFIGSMGIIAALLYHLFTTDPTQCSRAQ